MGQYQEVHGTVSRGVWDSIKRFMGQYQEVYGTVSRGVWDSIKRCMEQYQEVYGTVLRGGVWDSMKEEVYGTV